MAENRSERESGSDESTGTGRGFYLLLGVVAVVGVAALVFLGGGGMEPMGPLTMEETNVEPDSGAVAATRGPADAPVTIVEFVDYQCSHCRNFAALPGPALTRDYVRTGQARMVLYDFPLQRGSNAIPAALAARCAGEQGRYWEMHDLLFANQPEWVPMGNPGGEFVDYAEQAGLEMDAFRECYSEREYVPQIIASQKYGRGLGVNGTPTIYVNGRRAPDYGYGTLQEMIEAALDSLSGSGPAAAEGSPSPSSG